MLGDPYWDENGQEIAFGGGDPPVQVDQTAQGSNAASNAPRLQLGDQVDGKIVSICSNFAWVGEWFPPALILKTMAVNDDLYVADVVEIKEDHVVLEART